VAEIFIEKISKKHSKAGIKLKVKMTEQHSKETRKQKKEEIDNDGRKSKNLSVCSGFNCRQVWIELETGVEVELETGVD